MEYNGSKWWKFDFHTHTPASMDYGRGQLDLQHRTPKEWLLEHMRQGIDCIAVTDHNSGHWIDVLKSDLEIMRQNNVPGFRDVTLFPGVEISVNSNIHLLAIFDPSADSEHISNLLSRCEYEGSRGDSDSCTTKSFNDVVNIIHQMKGIAIPAHVDEARGLFVEQEGSALRTCLDAKGLLAIQVCNILNTKPQVYIDSKLSLSEVAGSDSHRPEQVGSVFTWVKMQKPNIEALRLALHDGEDGILRSDTTSGNPNDLKNRFYITSVQISKGQKAGRGAKPLKIHFSPWLNTIIGGRGSGKSSVIEYMRLPFNKTAGLPQKIADDFSEFNQIPSDRGKAGMLTADTEVRVEMRKDGRDVALIWKGLKITEQQKNEHGEWETMDEHSNIENRFPLRIFSQKHLYALTEDPNHILQIIDEQFDKQAWIEKREELAKQWLESKQKERDLSIKVGSTGNLKLELSDIAAKMKIFEDSGHKELLERYQKLQSLNTRLNGEINVVDDVTNKLIGIQVQEIPSLFQDSAFEELDPDSLEQLRGQAQVFDGIKRRIGQATKELVAYLEALNKAVQNIPWHTVRLETVEKYGEFVKLLEASGEKNSNAYSDLVNRKQELERKLTDFTALEEELANQAQASAQLLAEIAEHERFLREKRETTIKRWQGTDSSVRMYLNVMGDMDAAEISFRSAIRKTGSEFRKDLLERDDDGFPSGGALFELGTATNPWEKRTEIVRRFQAVTQSDNQKFGKLLARHILNMQPEDLERISIWYPEDKVILKIVENRKEEDIETGSAGQRTAAMLSLMLLLDDSPIIIDQPEEDLDTKRITDLVVKGFRDFKAKQQIIVITHNPNIPVNGAAENIIQMNFAGGQIQCHISGALQENDVREAVCEVMEGGKEALDKRYYRISRALDR